MPPKKGVKADASKKASKAPRPPPLLKFKELPITYEQHKESMKVVEKIEKWKLQASIKPWATKHLDDGADSDSEYSDDDFYVPEESPPKVSRLNYSSATYLSEPKVAGWETLRANLWEELGIFENHQRETEGTDLNRLDSFDEKEVRKLYLEALPYCTGRLPLATPEQVRSQLDRRVLIISRARMVLPNDEVFLEPKTTFTLRALNPCYAEPRIESGSENFTAQVQKRRLAWRQDGYPSKTPWKAVLAEAKEAKAEREVAERDEAVPATDEDPDHARRDQEYDDDEYDDEEDQHGARGSLPTTKPSDGMSEGDGEKGTETPGDEGDQRAPSGGETNVETQMGDRPPENISKDLETRTSRKPRRARMLDLGIEMDGPKGLCENPRRLTRLPSSEQSREDHPYRTEARRELREENMSEDDASRSHKARKPRKSSMPDLGITFDGPKGFPVSLGELGPRIKTVTRAPEDMASGEISTSSSLTSEESQWGSEDEDREEEITDDDGEEDVNDDDVDDGGDDSIRADRVQRTGRASAKAGERSASRPRRITRNTQRYSRCNDINRDESGRNSGKRTKSRATVKLTEEDDSEEDPITPELNVATRGRRISMTTPSMPLEGRRRSSRSGT